MKRPSLLIALAMSTLALPSAGTEELDQNQLERETGQEQTTCSEVVNGEEGVRESLRQIQQAFNEESVDLYARNVTQDLLNLIVYEVGGNNVRVTYDRDARLKELTAAFASNPYSISTSIEAREIYVAEDSAFAIFDVAQTAMPKDKSAPTGFKRTFDIYLFMEKEPCLGWQTERSMTIARSQVTLESK